MNEDDLHPENNIEVDDTTGEIRRPLSEVYDAENDITLYFITPLHSVSDILRFCLANLEYDVEEFLNLAEEITLGR